MRFYWPIAKVDHAARMVWGYASTEAEDDQGETIKREAIAAALDDYMRFANIREMHQASAVGVAKEAQLDDKGLYLGAKIVDEEAWRKVVEGVYKGFSIGGRVTARDPQDRKIITGLALTEISVVDRPANPEAVFDCWKRSDGGPRVSDAEPFTAPVQIWHCGLAARRHLAKAEAARCIERRAEEPGGEAGEGSERDDEPYGDVEYADPGYREDNRKRYPIDTEEHIRAAWAYIHQRDNARRYNTDQLREIKARILAAWRNKIDPAGPPGEPARKGGDDVARAARLMLELDWLCEWLAGEAGGPAETERLRAAIDELCNFLAALTEDHADETTDAAAELAAMALADNLRKRRRLLDMTTVGVAFAKLSGEIVPRLDALQKRVEEIARTPLPPLTAARGLSGISKREDGGAVASAEDVVTALARMSEEERTLALIKAAHANPIAPLGRPLGFTR